MQLPNMVTMKTIKQTEKKIIELTRELKGTEGSKAHGIKKQIDILNWVLE